jgi:DNA-nicking Smr family endonuclease
MRRKRRRARVESARERSENDRELSNRPFEDQLKDFKGTDRSSESDLTASPPGEIVKESDEDLFQQAMKDVVPLNDGRKKIVRSPSRREELPDHQQSQEERERQYLSALVKDSSAWDISFSDEYMVGGVQGVGPKIMRRLKRGEFSVQDYVDLHGLKKKEAEAVVREFIIKSYQRGLRCVLIVHGRGLGSVDHQPTIKRELPVWFRRGMLKRIVLAFVTARPCDGGAGALYVLLKKR